jgi:hypothetical protein
MRVLPHHQEEIVFQRGYWDKLTFLKPHGLPLEADSLPAGHSVS